EPAQCLAAPDNVPPIRDDISEALVEDGALSLLPAVESDAFGIFTQAHQAEAKIGLVALLVERQPYQRMTDPAGDEGAADRIDDGREDHVSRDVEMGAAAQRYAERTGQGPQDEQERQQRDDGVEQPDRQIEAAAGEAM